MSSAELTARAIRFATALRDRLTVGTVTIDLPIDKAPSVTFTAKIRGVSHGMSYRFDDDGGSFVPIDAMVEQWDREVRSKMVPEARAADGSDWPKRCTVLGLKDAKHAGETDEHPRER